MSDHVQMMIAIPPNYAVFQIVRYIKSKRAIHLMGVWRKEAQFRGTAFWVTGYFSLDG